MSKFRTVVSVIIMIIAGFVGFIAGKNNLSEKIRCFADLPDGHSVGWKDAFEKGFEIFYGSILNETEAVYESPDFAEGWYVTKIVEACLKSNQTGQWQNV